MNYALDLLQESTNKSIQLNNHMELCVAVNRPLNAAV